MIPYDRNPGLASLRRHIVETGGATSKNGLGGLALDLPRVHTIDQSHADHAQLV